MQPLWEGIPSIGNIVVGLVAGFGVSLLIGLVVVHYFHEWLKGKLQQFANPKVRPSQIALRPNCGPGAWTLDAASRASTTFFGGVLQ